MILEQIKQLVASDMDAVDHIIRKNLNSDVSLIREITEYIVKSGGKRLRPMLVLLSAGALAYEGDNHHKLAAVVEMIHTATLLHDDVVDESDLRRGRKTANTVYGNAASILVGDFLYSKTFQLVLDVDQKVVMPVIKVLSSASVLIAEGEVMQLMNCHNADIDEASYLQIICYKTAKLFECSTQVGAIIAGASPLTESALADYGRHLGIAFQLIDDVLDYSASEAETGKHLGDDLAEGKLTLPLIYAMKHGNQEQSRCVRHAVEQGGRDDFAEVLQVIRETGALDHARARAGQESQKAIDALSILPASTYRDSLLELASFAAARSF